MISALSRLSFDSALLDSLKNAATSTSSPLDTDNGNAFRAKLEKHLHDHIKGEGYMSSPMYSVVQGIDEQNATALTNMNPPAAAKYEGYMTAGLSYTKKARFITGVQSAVSTEAQLKGLFKTA